MSDTPAPPSDLTAEPPDARDLERPASEATRDDLPSSGEHDAAPVDAIVAETSEVAPADTQVAEPVLDAPVESDVDGVVVDASDPVLDDGADRVPADDSLHVVSDEAVYEGGGDAEALTRAPDAPVEAPEDDAPEPGSEPVATAAAESAATPEPAPEDDLDDLLDIAGAGGDGFAEPGETVPAERAVEASTEDVAEPAATPEADAAPEPAVRPRPRAIEQVRDQRDLKRMLGDWYVVHTYAGYEQRVKDNLSSRVESLDAHDRIFEVVIPTEEVTEFKKGKKTTAQRKFLPGYVLVRMEMDDETWGIVRHTPAVTGFVGSPGGRPVPLSLKEVAGTLRIPEEFVEETEGTEAVVVPAKPEIDIDLEIGETVRVTTGPFADFTGSIAEINVHQAKLKVMVSVFGRETPLELPFDNVAKL